MGRTEIKRKERALAIDLIEGKTHVAARRLDSASRALELKSEKRKKSRKMARNVSHQVGKLNCNCPLVLYT